VGATATTAPAPGPAALSQDLQASLRAVVAVVGQPVPMETLATRPPTPDAAPAAAPATLRDTKRDTAPVLSEGMAGGPMLLALQSPAVDPMQAPHPKEQGAVQAPAAGVDALASAVVPAPPTPGSESRAMSPIPLPHPQAPAAGYGDELGASVVWMAEQRIGHAELQVAPDHLGPVEVRLQIDGAHVRAEFYSAQPDVRHALEATLPRLRDMLGQHGLQLGHAGVGQRDQQASQPRSQSPGQEEPGIQSTSGDGVARFRHASVVRGLLDEYA
jgi:flagellar hook-length control protein FliK